MKNLPKEKRERLILVIIGTLVIMVAIYYGVIGTQRTTLVQTLQRAKDEQNRVNNGQRLAGSVAQLQKGIEASEAQLKAIEGNMASGDMYSWIILTINNFKENGGYKVEIPTFSREIIGEVGMLTKFPYRAASFSVRGTAHFHEFGRFVADLENAFPYLRIQNLELDPGSSTFGNGSEDPEKLGFRMEIVTLVNPNR